jgi:hypothetical protein
MISQPKYGYRIEREDLMRMRKEDMASTIPAKPVRAR